MTKQIGSYRIDGVLGQGGMGVVYKGWHDALNRPAAIKTFLRGNGTSSDIRKRFLAEGQAQAQLKNPRIVAVYDLFEHEGDLYIAMEYVEGQSLANVLAGCRDRRMQSEDALPLIEQMLDALAYVHSQNIVHRDIKPSNVMICRDGVKLMDFGIALQAGEPRLTASQRAIGTPPYMSPEQLQAKDVDARTDVYSAAVVLFEMLAGTLPFSGKNFVERIHPPDLATLVPDVRAGICSAIAIALQFEADDRFPSAIAFRDALREGAIGFLPVAPPTVDDDLAAAATIPIAAEPVIEHRSRRAAAVAWVVIGGSVMAGTAMLVDKLERPPVTPHKPPPVEGPGPETQPPVTIHLGPYEPKPVAPKQTPRIGVVEQRVSMPVVDTRKRDIELLRTEIEAGLVRAEAENTAQQFERALGELNAVDGKIARYPGDFRAEAERATALRTAANAGVLAAIKHAQELARWQDDLAQIERDLSAGNWGNVQRDARRMLEKDPPQPFATRAAELLDLGIAGLRIPFDAEGKVGETTYSVVGKPAKKKKP